MITEHELSVRDAIVKQQVECYLPTRHEVRQLKYRSKEVEVPIIRNLIFVHATKQQAIDLHNIYRIPLYYISDLSKPGMLIVPDKQMNDFIQLMNYDPEAVSFDDSELIPGDRVVITKGHLTGLEGRVASVNRSTYIIIRLQGVLTASIKEIGRAHV